MKTDGRPGWLFVSPWNLSSAGGVNTVIEELITKINLDGKYRPYLLSLDWGEEEPKIDNQESYTHISIRLSPWDTSNPKAIFSFLLRHSNQSNKIRKLLNEYNIQVLNIHYPTPETIPLARLKESNIRVIVSFHGTDLTTLENASKTTRKTWGYFLSRADGIVTCSSGQKNRLIKCLPNIKLDISVIANGVRTTTLLRRKKNLQLEGDKRTILTVGTYNHNKAQDILLKSFAKFVSRHPEWRLIVAGRTGPSYNACRTLAKSLCIENKVTLLTDIPRHDMHSLYSTSNIFVMPSRSEAFGLVILEAAIFSLPVISTATEGALDIIEKDVDGIIVEIDNIVELTQALVQLAESPQTRVALAQKLRRKVLSRFTWKKSLSKYYDLAISEYRDC